MKWVLSGRGIAAVACAIVMGVPTVQAKEWAPRRPVAFIVGSAAGGGIDLTARLLQRLWEHKGIVTTPIVVINKPGAGNSIAWQYVNDRGGDGNAIAVGTANLVSNPTAPVARQNGLSRLKNGGGGAMISWTSVSLPVNRLRLRPDVRFGSRAALRASGPRGISLTPANVIQSVTLLPEGL